MINETEAGSLFKNKLRTPIYTAALCDILDELGYRNQAMHHRLRPLLPDMRDCGRTCALKFAGEGANVVIADINEEVAAKTVKQI